MSTKIRNIIYIEFIVFAGLLGIAVSVLTINGQNMATLSNTFATISGVLLGLHFVVKPQEGDRDHVVTQLLLFTILVSVTSSLFSLDQLTVSSLTKTSIFAINGVLFEFST